MIRPTVLVLLILAVSLYAESDALIKYDKIPEFTPVDNYARIVIIRHKGHGPRTSDEVMFYVDRMFVSEATEYSIVSFPVEPGKHYLSGLYDDDEDKCGSSMCTFAPGKVYYFHCVNFYMFSFAGTNVVLMSPISPGRMKEIMAEAEKPVHYYEYDWSHPKADTNILDPDEWEDVLEHHKDWSKDNRADYEMQIKYNGY